MEKKYFVQKVKQRNEAESVEFVVFVANTRDVQEWAGIRRVGEEEKGTQRVLKNTRVKAITRFLESNKINTIPVSAILAFNPGAANFDSLSEKLSACDEQIDFSNNTDGKLEPGILSFNFDPNSNEADRPALIVDGQHRIKGMAAVQENIPIVIAALINAEPQEQAFQFVVINNKAQKVRTDNVKAIIKNIDEEGLQNRLLEAGVNYGKWPATLGDVDGLEESPFYHLLEWPLNPTPNKRIQLTTIESCLRYIRDTFQIIEDDDSQKMVFIWIWKGVKEYYTDLWDTNEKFMSKVNIIALNEFVIDRLENAWIDENVNIYELEDVKEYVKTVLVNIPQEYWTPQEWNYKLQDNATVRNSIKDDLKKITQNARVGRKWNEGLKMISE